MIRCGYIFFTLDSGGMQYIEITFQTKYPGELFSMKCSVSQRVLDVLEWETIIKEIVSRCSTVPGEVFAAGIVPVETEAIRQRLREIHDIRELHDRDEGVDFSGVTDIAPFLTIAEKGGSLKLDELAAVRDFIIASNRIQSFLREAKEEYPDIGERGSRFQSLDAIGRIMIPAITDTGSLSEARFPVLRKLNDEIHSVREQIEKTLMEFVNMPDVAKLLQERVFTTRNERYVVLLKSNFRGRLKGTVHDVSSSESTLYIEPERITDLNNRLIMRQRELKEEVLRILRELTGHVGSSAGEIEVNLDETACLDFLCAAARFSAAIKGHPPEISGRGVLCLFNARHPSLYLRNPEGVVGNDISLGEDYTSLIITGANTGGKTVLLKTVGLTVLMAMHGLHIPAGPDSRMGVFSRVFADIGDDQNLAQSLSTFSGQIVTLCEMYEQSDDASLLLVDEIVVGTSPRQGAALARALLEGLADTGARMIVTTHYSELKDLAVSDGRFQNASVAFNTDSLEPTYRLVTGVPGGSYALEIAKNYGVPDSVIARSMEFLNDSELSADALIERVQRLEEDLRIERGSIEELKHTLQRQQEQYVSKQKELLRLEEQIKTGKGIEFIEELNRLRGEVAEKIRTLQQGDMREAGKLQEEMIDLGKRVSDEVKKSKTAGLSDAYVPFDPESVSVQDRVLVVPIGKEGTVESIDVHSGTAGIILGNAIRSRYAFGDLLVPRDRPKGKRRNEPPRKQKKKITDHEGQTTLTIQTSFNTIDLRGKRVDEALQEMEYAIDGMVRSGIRSAVIIHGHGTGAMKEAVRQWLRYSSYVTQSRPGEYGEGGDGVTIAQLRD